MILGFTTKKEIIYNLLQYKEHIPLNDFEAYSYPSNLRYLHLYDRYYIFFSQGMKCGLEPPLEYPVFVKPRVNLAGMGKNALIITNLDSYKNHVQKCPCDELFWAVVLVGEHLSIDFFFKESDILHTIVHKGKSAENGTFEYWETLLDYKVSPSVRAWVIHNLRGYTGMVNLETIDGIIIESHLRFGDIHFIDQIQNDDFKICQAIINLYSKNDIDISTLKGTKIYHFPVFVTRKGYIHDLVSFDEARNICKKYVGKSGNIILQKDLHPDLCSNPVGGIRIFSVMTYKFNEGKICQNKLLECYNNRSKNLLTNDLLENI